MFASVMGAASPVGAQEPDDNALPPVPDWFNDLEPSTPDDDPVAPPFEPGESAAPIESTPLEATAAASLPAPGVAEVTLGTRGVEQQADGLPVAVAADARSADGIGVQVEVLDQAVSQRVGISGFAFRLLGSGGSDLAATAASDAVPATLTLDYSAFKDLYGAGYADRLQVVALPECALADPIPADCDTLGKPLPSQNDRSKSVLEVDVADLADLQGTPLVTSPAPEAADEPEQPESPTTTESQSDAGDDATPPSTAGRGADAAAPASVPGGAVLVDPATPAQTSGGGGVVLAMMAGAEGEEGSFKATPFSASGDWQVGVGSGEFSWSYPIPLPPSPAGATPSLSMSYSSAAVDGFVTSKNTQAGQAGLGWSDFNSAFIERRYNSCADDAGDVQWQTPDLCWASDNASISLNGQSSELVPWIYDGDVPVMWRLKSDTRWKVERKYITDPLLTNHDNDGEYWVVTTPDGTTYWFGLGRSLEGGWETASTWTVPVFGDDPDDPCNGATPAASVCDQAWRWNLDRVVDPNGNMQVFRYGTEANNYMRFDGVGQPRVLTSYIRSGHATEVQYGRTEGGSGSPIAKAVIESNWRCRTLDAPDTPVCQAPNVGGVIDPTQHPDIPTDLFCVNDACQQYSPTFFSSRRYTGVRTYAVIGGTDLPQDYIKLTHAYQDPEADSTDDTKLWLTGIQRTGLASDNCPSGECSSITLPATTFAPAPQEMNNRHNPALGESYMPHWRLGQITDEFGGQINVVYGQPHPCDPPPKEGDPGAFDWHNNTTDCFPQMWAPEGSEDPPTFRAFNKFLVMQVEVKDTTGGSPPMVTRYFYGDKINDAAGAPQTWNASRDAAGAAWHHDSADAWVPQANQSWSDWRGYQDVLVTQESTRTRYKVYRGMNGDQTEGGYRTVQLTSFDGTVSGVAGSDDNWFSGQILDEMSLRLDGSPETGTVHTYQGIRTADVTTDPDPLLDAYWVGEVDTVQRLRTPASGTEFRRKRTQTSYNGFLQFPEKVIEHGWTDLTTDNRCTTTGYVFDASSWMIDYPYRVAGYANATCDQTATARSETSYDGLVGGQVPTEGNPTSSRTQISGSSFTTGTWATTGTTYDDWGRPVTVTDPNNNTTTTDYDGDPNYDPTSLGYSASMTMTNAAGHVTRTNFVYNHPNYVVADTRVTLGRQLPAETIDPNGNVSRYSYDELGRVTTARQSTEIDGGPASWTFGYDIDPNKSQVPVIHSAQLQDNSGPSGTPRYLNSWSVYDSLLRERQTHLQSPTQTKTIVTDTVYDNRGLAVVTGSPEPVEGTAGQGILPTPAGGWANRTETHYDHASRPFLVLDINDDSDPGTLADNLYRYSAPVYTHDSVDSRWQAPGGAGVGTRTRTITDAYGRTASVDEHDGTAWRATAYTYDDADRLQTVIDPANNKITYTYDMAGRRIAMDDPDAGDWSYGYDLAGNQTTVTDATNETTATAYDALNRPTERHEGSVAGPLLVSWDYDAAGEAGLLDFSTRHTPTGDEWIVDVTGYDARNRESGRSWTVPASETALVGTYSVSYGYDAADHQTSVAYPAVGGLPEETVTTAYNSIGLPESLDGAQSYVYAAAYDERARPFVMGFGTPTAATMSKVWTYDNNQRLSRTQVATGAGIVSDRQIGYDIVGNVTERNTNLNGGKFRECFGYDQRDRLVSAYTTTDMNTCISGTQKGQGAHPYSHTYTYTVDGNLKTSTEPGVPTTYTYPTGTNPVRPHAPTAVGSNSYTWDANGNEATRTIGGQTDILDWDAEHRLASIDSPAGDSSFVYDPGGQRLLRTTPQGRTLYIEGHEVTAPTTGSVVAVRSYGIGGQPVATRSTAGGVDFLAADNQGSVELEVGYGSSGTPETVRTYLPYGKVRTGGQLDTDHSWIGQVEDDNTGLQYLNARYYDPTIGVFTSSDPIADLQAPKTFNPYGYARNNPSTYADPTGQCDWGVCNFAEDVWDDSGGVLVAAADDCIGDLGGCGVNIAKGGAAIAIGWAAAAACDFVTLGFGANNVCVVAGAAAAGAAFGAFFCPEGEDSGDCAGEGAKVGAAGGAGFVAGGPIGAGMAAAWAAGGDASEIIGGGILSALFTGVSKTAARSLRGKAKVPARGQDLLRPGPWAKRSIPSSGGARITPSERPLLNKLGRRYGCHSCGSRSSGIKSGNWIGDHMLPTRLNPLGRAQRLYPHCKVCSWKQGLEIARGVKSKQYK